MFELETEHGTLRLDDEDAPLLEGKTLRIHVGGVHRPQYRILVSGKDLCRLVAQAPPGTEVDHLNHDQLDNRRSNLRLATKQENLRYRRGWGKKNGHGYKGLVWKADKKTWSGRIVVDGKRKTAGGSTNVHKAALKWNRYAIAAYGEFAYPNDVPCFSDSPIPREDRCPTCNSQCDCCCVCE